MLLGLGFAPVYPHIPLNPHRALSVSQFLECLVAVAAKMEKSDDVSLAIKVRSSCVPFSFLLTREQVEALMQALTGEKSGSRPSTGHSKAIDGAEGEGKCHSAAVRVQHLI